MLDEADKQQTMEVTVTMSHLESYVLEKLMGMAVRRELIARCQDFFGPNVTEDEIMEAWDSISEKVDTAMQDAW